MKHCIIIIIIIFFSCNTRTQKDYKLLYQEEVHLKNIQQLTFGGDNAEAYWSFDYSKLVFQAKNKKWGAFCDQIYVTDVKNHNMKNKIPQQISTGLGRTTCSYFLPGDSTIIYASTHLADSLCPEEPKRKDGKYV